MHTAKRSTICATGKMFGEGDVPLAFSLGIGPIVVECSSWIRAGEYAVVASAGDTSFATAFSNLWIAPAFW